MKNLKHILYLAFAASALLLAGCNSDEPGPNKEPSPKYKIPTTQQQLNTIGQANKTAVEMWNVLAPLSNEDILFSPFNVQMSLSMLANGVDDPQALNELTSLYVNANSENALAELNELNRFLLAELPKVDNSAKINIANAVWYSDTQKLNADFERAVKEYYSASGYAFTKGSKEALNAMDKWVNDNTYGFIKTMGGEITHLDLLAANVTYFKAIWRDPFDSKLTRKENFTMANGQAKMVDMMHGRNIRTTYGETDDFQTFILPYGNGGYSMTIVFPKEGKEIAQCDISGVVAGNIGFDGCELTLAMPRFESEVFTSPIDILASMGYTSIYNGIATSTRIFNGESPKLFKAGQKAKIKVDESGTEAAAIPDIFTDPGPQIPLNIELNRPFIYIIKETSTGAVLFIGSKSRF